MSTVTLTTSSLKKGFKTKLIVEGRSMFPLISSGAKVEIIPKKFSEINLYDVVAVDLGSKIVIHQCIFKSSKYLVCYGINNKFIDLPVNPDQILGVVETGNYWKILNLIYSNELKKINESFGKSILILKGAIWQKNFFGYFLNKPVSDIDVFIRKKDYLEFRRVVVKNGYRIKKDITNEISFYKKINSKIFAIDVHFQFIRSALNPIFRFPIDPKTINNLTLDFWKSASKKNNFFFLKNEYLLFYFCLNSIFHHGVRGVDLLGQIANIIDKEKIDWNNFWGLAKRYKMSNFVYYPLGWVSRLFKIKIPDLRNHRPLIWRRFLMKLLINKRSVFRPFTNLGENYLAGRANVALIFLIRLILYEK